MTAAVFVVSNINSLSSYRAELEGTFRLLKHIEYLGMTPEEVTHWCDNEAAVLDTNKTEPACPSELIGADADIILAIMHHKRKTGIKSTCHHVHAHQDEKKRKTKEEQLEEKKQSRAERRRRIREVDVGDGTHAPSPPPSPHSDSSITDKSHKSRLSLPRRELGRKDLSDEAMMNIACDEYAEEAAKEHIKTPQAPFSSLQPPYEGSKAMLKISNVWITSNHDRSIHFASRAPSIKKYCKGRHKWSSSTMNMVNWDIIDRARRNQKWSAFSRSMKIMHGWLPLMHNLGKRTGIAQCPGCECPDETYNHMFNCGNALMKKALSESFETMRKVARATGVPDQAMDAFMSCITNGIHNRPAPPPQYPKELEKAVENQNKTAQVNYCRALWPKHG